MMHRISGIEPTWRPMRYESNDKRSVRSRLLRLRAVRTAAERATAEHGACTAALTVPELSMTGSVVCCYAAIRDEPPTGLLLDALRSGGVTVLLPVLLADGDLEWAAYEGDASMQPGLKGTREPSGPRLGVDAVSRAYAVLVPGVAVDSTGVRLGRGGGSYDRALARVPARTFTAVILYDNEILEALPHEPHDQRVSAAITPTRVVRFARHGSV